MNSNKTVLVISDGHEQFTSTASILENAGYRVLFERDIYDSISKAQFESPKLIISELAVPNIDGLELCLRVRRDQSLASTPVLLIGDLSERSSIVEDSFRCGAADYVQRPIDPFQLATLVHEIVAKHEFAPDPSEENLFSLLIENISDLIAIVDAEDGIVLFETPSIKKLLAFAHNELLGRSIFDLVHPLDQTGFVGYLHNARKSTPLPPFECRFRHRDGHWMMIESTARAIDGPKFGTAVVITAREALSPKPLAEKAILKPVLEEGEITFAPSKGAEILDFVSWRIDHELICEN